MTRTYTRPIMPTRTIPVAAHSTHPAPTQMLHHKGHTGWTAEDAARRPAAYLRWLQTLSTERWLAIHAAPQRSAQDFDQAIAECRAYKAKYTEYTRHSSPIQMRPELQRLQTQMRTTLKRLNFASPAALWEAYQEQIAARDRHGRHPHHAAHIASVEHYQWLCAISHLPPLDYYAGSTDGLYNNVDMALERARQPRTTYAPADDADSPAARLTYLHTRITHRQAQRDRLEPRILGLNRRLKMEQDPRRRIAYQTRKERLQTIYRQAGQELRAAQAEHDELDLILHPHSYGIQRDPADQRELVALAAPDYGLTSTPPIPTNGRWQVIDLDGRLADTLDSIRSLLSWHVCNQDVIFEMETYPQDKRSLAHTAHLAARYELQDDLIRSLGQHHRRQLARHAPAPPLPVTQEIEDWL